MRGRQGLAREAFLRNEEGGIDLHELALVGAVALDRKEPWPPDGTGRGLQVCQAVDQALVPDPGELVDVYKRQPQAWYNAQAGIKKIATETGAGQWGSSLAFAGALFGIDVTVFQVRVSYDQKPYRRALMETYGATCHASPSPLTQAGRAILAKDPNHPGSLGIAISEAVEVAATHDDTKYALGSVLNHVLMHQTIIGQEALLQLEMAGDDPDVIVGCTGGGSNFAGIAFPFLGQQLRGGKKRRIVAVEPAACPSLTRGKFAYDFGDTAHLTPLTKMHTLGSTCLLYTSRCV